MEGNDFPTVVIGSVGGPGQVGPEPMDAFHRLKFVLSHLPGEGSDLTARDAWRELTMQLSGAARAGALFHVTACTAFIIHVNTPSNGGVSTISPLKPVSSTGR